MSSFLFLSAATPVTTRGGYRSRGAEPARDRRRNVGARAPTLLMANLLCADDTLFESQTVTVFYHVLWVWRCSTLCSVIVGGARKRIRRCTAIVEAVRKRFNTAGEPPAVDAASR